MVRLIADLFRVLLVFVPAALIVGVTVLVVLVYLKSYSNDLFKAARKGLLPSHVWMIGTSYVVLVVDEVLRVFEHRNQGFNYHLIILAPTMCLGLLAIVTIFRYENKRYAMEKTTNRDIKENS